MTTEPATFPTHPATRLTLWFGARDHDHHGSLLVHIMQRARSAGLAGATAFEAHEGFGGSRHLHRTHVISDDAPIVIVVVDERSRIESFLETSRDLLRNVVVTMSDVTVVEV